MKIKHCNKVKKKKRSLGAQLVMYEWSLPVRPLQLIQFL